MVISEYFKIWNWWRATKKQAVKEVTVMEENKPIVKPGYKTTEFWMSVLASASGLIGQIQGSIPEPWGVVAATIITAAYTVARAIAKKS